MDPGWSILIALCSLLAPAVDPLVIQFDMFCSLLDFVHVIDDMYNESYVPPQYV